MRRTHLPRLLCLLLALLLLSGCRTTPKPADAESSVPSTTELPTESAAETTAEPSSEPETVPSEPEIVPAEPEYTGPSLTWQEAFRNKELPEGVLTPDEIAFYQTDGETVSIVNVPREEVFSYQPERLPRAHYYEQFMSDAVREELLPILDYALAHGYSRCSIPTTTISRGLLYQDGYYLNQTYRVNNSGIGSLDVRTFEQEDGSTLIYLLATINGMDGRGMMQQYLEGISAAEALVDSIPADYDEMQKALYLYQYLTVNVRYDYDNYYDGSTNLLYDSMVKHLTVCAGYTEAFYYLCNLAGIECITLDGYISDLGNGAEVGDTHIWNAAKVNGTWYQFDSTWDEGLSVADYAYFGVSDAYMLANHTELIAEKCKGYAPECPASLFPDQDPSMWEEQSGYKILWYFRLRNTRDTDPLQIFPFFAEDRPAVVSEKADGWVVTDAAYDSLLDMLDYLMTPEEAARFCEGHIEDRDGSLAYRLPEDPDPSFRLCSLTPEADGSWLAEGFLLLPDGFWEPAREYVTGMEEDGDFWVSSVRRDG